MTNAAPLGTINLFVPQDWFDLLEDGPNREATRNRCTEIVRLTYPRMSQPRRNEITGALMAWYEQLLKSGLLLYGIVSSPLSQDTTETAHWQVLAGVVDVSPGLAEVDLGALLAKTFGERQNGATYQESFTTDMGIGFGFISQPTVPVPGDGESYASETQIGLVGALSCPPGGDKGILVIGISLAAEQVWQLAGLVSAIAGRSTFNDPAANQPTEAVKERAS
ncbi:hypothetical protein [Streptomyces sp. NPDC051776]|uniref:hypothetical protein n=1 Tax=Streptomyces sp. NPDC051776 TaxID=3155414 RepID=UPI003449EF73